MASLAELPFPLLLAADDGWVEEIADAGVLARWNARAIRKYRTTDVTLLDATGRAWRLSAIAPIRAPSLWQRLRGTAVPCDVAVAPLAGDALSVFRRTLDRALEAGGDLLAQFEDAATIRGKLAACNDAASLRAVLRQSGALG